MKSNYLFPLIALFFPVSIIAENLYSPNRTILVKVEINNGYPEYSVLYKNKTVLFPSKLGFIIKQNDSLFNDRFTIQKIEKRIIDEKWSPILGEVKEIRNNCNELAVTLAQEVTNRKCQIIFRAFNDGIAFQYNFPVQKELSTICIKEELTEFNLGCDYKAFWIPGDYDTNEHPYTTSLLSEIPSIWPRAIRNFSHTPISKVSVQTPLMLKSKDGIYINIHEAKLIDYPAMSLSLDEKRFSFVSTLTPDASGYKGRISTNFSSPWRTIIVSDKASDIIVSKMILNLNDPSALNETSWIKPIKYLGVWWEMFLPNRTTWNYTDSTNLDILKTDYHHLKPNNRHAATTENVKKYIDFASLNGFDALLVEGWNIGWEDWYGKQKVNVFDFVTPYPDFNLPEISQYATKKGVQMIMHHETSASVSNYERRMDSAYAFMKKYGYNIVKTGYVGDIIPYGEHHYGQTMVNHYLHSIKKCADSKILINIHEPVRPTGLHRTFPNFISCESARGTEFEAFSGNAPDHQTILPFTRLIGGPMDYTPGIFQTDFTYYDKNSTNRVNTTLAKQLALYVVIYSPFQMAADLPENYNRFPDAFQFIKDVALDWDNTQVLEAEPGDYLTIARKTKGKEEWFIGGITDESSRVSRCSLDFLEKGRRYKATIYSDKREADYLTNPQAYDVFSQEVTSKSVLQLYMARSGGFAIRILPIVQ